MNLSQVSETEKKVFQFICEKCQNQPQIKRALLFGSRARRDHDERSDFDIAIEGAGISNESWAQFAIELRESIPTLCGIDLIYMNDSVSKELLNKIKKEGVKIYERR